MKPLIVTGSPGAMSQEIESLLHRKGVGFISASDPQWSASDNDMSSLTRMMQGSSIVVVLPSWEEKGLQRVRRTLDAAVKTHVQFVLRISVLGATSGALHLYQQKMGEIDEMIEESGMPFGILRPTPLMQTFTSSLLSDVQKGALYLPEGEGRISYLDGRDLAQVVWEVIEDPWRYYKARVDLTGGRCISKAEVAALLSYSALRRISYVPVTEEYAQKIFSKKALSDWEKEMRLSFYRSVREGAFEVVTDRVEEILGAKPRTFENFCREMRELWRTSPLSSYESAPPPQ